MIDKKARKQLASAIRNYASGLVNNEEFEELLPHWHSKDYAVSEIDYLGIGPYYKDDGVIKIKLSQEERKEFARWILFLQTDNEYEWPVYNRDRLNKFHEVILDIFTLGQSNRSKAIDKSSNSSPSEEGVQPTSG
jgi:hypothetical protein